MRPSPGHSQAPVAVNPAAAPWRVRTLRLTVFLAPEAVETANAAAIGWEDLVGAKPETALNKGDVQEGPLPPGRLLLQKQIPSRVDLLYGGFPRSEPEDPVATLGPFEPAHEVLRGVAQRLFAKLGGCVRIALGTELVQSAPTVQAAYKMLVEHMRSAQFTLGGGEDFIYQMNRPRMAVIMPELRINRLTQWHASSWQAVSFEMGAGARVIPGRVNFGAVVTTDINTDGEWRESLPGEKLIALYDELGTLTMEIRDKGDVP